MAMLTIRALSKRHTGGGGIEDVNLTIESGERVVLLGPSGSGKTTLLRLIAGLETPDSGSIEINGQSMKHVLPHQRGIAFVPQKPALYPEMTVRELVGPHADLIERLTLAPLLNRLPHQLSGGEKQRVSLARAVARGATIWLLDEPFAALDPPFRAEFRSVLHLLAERSRATIILVTHDPVDAWALGRRVGVLGDGRLQCFGPPEELRRRPGNRFVAFCLGSFCFVDGVVSDGRSGLAGRGESVEMAFISTDGSVVSPLPQSLRDRLSPASHLTLGFRPEDVRSDQTHGSPDSARLIGWTPESAEPFGSGWILTLARGQGRARAVWPPDSPLPVGRVADWSCPANQCVWFDAAGNRLEV